jgi:hypothetical protein
MTRLETNTDARTHGHGYTQGHGQTQVKHRCPETDVEEALLCEYLPSFLWAGWSHA